MRVVLLLLVLTLPAWADEQKPISDEYKTYLLKEAYHLNGDSMVRWGCIDMSNPIAGPAPCPIPGRLEPKPEQDPAPKK